MALASRVESDKENTARGDAAFGQLLKTNDRGRWIAKVKDLGGNHEAADPSTLNGMHHEKLGGKLASPRAGGTPQPLSFLQRVLAPIPSALAVFVRLPS